MTDGRLQALFLLIDSCLMRPLSFLLPDIRKFGVTFIVTLLTAIHCAGVVSAQQPAETPQRAVVEAPSKSYVVEGIIFAALCGAALFAVCRSSPRGN